MARIAGRRRCIAPDLMGLGYSKIPDGAGLSPVAQSRMIVAFMDWRRHYNTQRPHSSLGYRPGARGHGPAE